MLQLPKLHGRKYKTEKILIVFLSAWFLLNILQALYTGLHPDEAYYWLYGKFLAWGYFDHPPMVALFIKGGSFINSTFGLRFFTIVTNLLSIYLLWLIVKKYKANVYVFATLFSSVLVFHVYSFITTPDAPLFFFAVLFLYVYQQYVKTDRLLLAILLGFIAAALLYSKYHGILLLFFVLIANLKLFKRPSFYIIMAVALIVFIPHIYWQYQNNFPSLQYHLIDRSTKPYQISYALKYISTIILMGGPLTGWFLLVNAANQKHRNDIFLRSLKYLFYGIFIFFFIGTFKGEVQAHWPLVGYIPALLLATISLSHNQFFWQKKWIKILFTLNISLIILSRLLIMLPIAPLNSIKFIADFNNFDLWAQQIKNYSKSYPVIFLDGFQDPSLYNYYTQSTKGFDYDSYNYRKTQFEIFPIEDSIRNKKVYFVATASHQKPNQDTLKTIKGIYYGVWLDSLRTYQKVIFTALNTSQKWKPNETKTIVFKIENPYKQTVNFNNNGQEYLCNLKYIVQKNGVIFSEKSFNSDFEKISIAKNSYKTVALKITAPNKTDNYTYFIVLQTEPFAGSRNSAMLKMNVK